MITFTPLSSSAQSLDSTSTSASTGPISYLLELDDIKILLDLGGRDPRVASQEGYDAGYEKKVKE
jgi:cleavage and polyadenylation specificity factor subunit 2